MTRVIIAILVGLSLMCQMSVGVSLASGPTAGGPFEQLSQGNQKAVRALYEAQRPGLRPGDRLTMDQIAARKQNGQGWTRIFDGMKSAGLVEARTFGEVIQSFDERHEVASASPRTQVNPDPSPGK
jgi:hypothetical protein